MAGRYDLESLSKTNSELKAFLKPGNKGFTIDFADPHAVKALNKALLLHHYSLEFWDIPAGFLCPPIPGRLDYIHTLADVLAENNQGRVPAGKSIRGLDIGAGASLIYPILAHMEYGWNIVGSDVSKEALDNANLLVSRNQKLKKAIDIRHQGNSDNFFKGIIQAGEYYDFSLCNPPFYSSHEEALNASRRKWNNLQKKVRQEAVRNFGGQVSELVYPGGEKNFIKYMIRQSRPFSNNVLWFSTLVSDKSLIYSLKSTLAEVKVNRHMVRDVSHGNKKSRILFWTYLDPAQAGKWASMRWKKQ